MESHFRLADLRFTLREFVCQPLENFVGLLPDRRHAILDTVELFLDALKIHIGTHGPDLFGIVFALNRTATHNGGHSFHLLIAGQPMGNIDHDITCPDYCHMLAHLERPITETRQPVEVIHHVFCVVHTLGGIPFHPDGLGPLRPDREHHCAGAESPHLLDSKVLAVSDRNVPQIVHIRPIQQIPILLLETTTELELGGENSVFRQAAKLDITVENNDFVAGLGHGPGNCHSCRPGTDDDNYMRIGCGHTLFLRKGI